MLDDRCFTKRKGMYGRYFFLNFELSSLLKGSGYATFSMVLCPHVRPKNEDILQNLKGSFLETFYGWWVFDKIHVKTESTAIGLYLFETIFYVGIYTASKIDFPIRMKCWKLQRHTIFQEWPKG